MIVSCSLPRHFGSSHCRPVGQQTGCPEIHTPAPYTSIRHTLITCEVSVDSLGRAYAKVSEVLVATFLALLNIRVAMKLKQSCREGVSR